MKGRIEYAELPHFGTEQHLGIIHDFQLNGIVRRGEVIKGHGLSLGFWRQFGRMCEQRTAMDNAVTGKFRRCRKRRRQTAENARNVRLRYLFFYLGGCC